MLILTKGYNSFLNTFNNITILKQLKVWQTPSYEKHTTVDKDYETLEELQELKEELKINFSSALQISLFSWISLFTLCITILFFGFELFIKSEYYKKFNNFFRG